MVINNHTLKLQQEITKLEILQQRKEIIEIIKNNKEWQDRYIKAFEPTEEELLYIKEEKTRH